MSLEEQYEIVAPEKVFNLPLYSVYTVIDCRARADFEKSSIVTSHSFPPTPETVPGGQNCNDSAAAGSETEQQRLVRLSQFVCDLAEEFAPEHVSPIVLYDDNTVGTEDGEERAYEPSTHVKWLVGQFHRIKQGVTQLSTLSRPSASNSASDASSTEAPHQAYDPIKHFCDRVLQRTEAIWVINGGFHNFASRFPGLCGPAIRVEDMVPTPALVTCATASVVGTGGLPTSGVVFIGSRVLSGVASLSASIVDLGVTHAVVDGDTAQGLLAHNDSTDGVAVPGLSVLLLDKADSNSTDMTEAFYAAIDFITQAHAQGGRVCLQFHGRSRSFGLALAWLVLGPCKQDIDIAIQGLMADCPKADTTLSFVDQIRDIASRRQITNAPATV